MKEVIERSGSSDSGENFLLSPMDKNQTRSSMNSVKTQSFSHPSVRSSFSYFQDLTERKEKILKERSEVKKYALKLKCMSLFYVLFAIFILLNSCIGFSSSPYYSRYTDCNQYKNDPQCKSLRHRVDVMYACELLGSVLLVTHGLIGMILLENLKVIKIAKVLNYYSKVAPFFYGLLILLRMSYYIDILPMLEGQA